MAVQPTRHFDDWSSFKPFEVLQPQNDAAFDAMLEANPNCVVYFYKGTVLASLYPLFEQFAQRQPVTYAEVDVVHLHNAATRWNVMETPVFLAIADGKEVDRFHGTHETELREFLTRPHWPMHFGGNLSGAQDQFEGIVLRPFSDAEFDQMMAIGATPGQQSNTNSIGRPTSGNTKPYGGNAVIYFFKGTVITEIGPVFENFARGGATNGIRFFELNAHQLKGAASRYHVLDTPTFLVLRHNEEAARYHGKDAAELRLFLSAQLSQFQQDQTGIKY